jgi:hypothetical protein
LRFVTFPFDIANHRQGYAVSTEHTPDGHKAHQAHEEVAHAAGLAADIGHLGEHNLKLVHHLSRDLVEVIELRPLPQHGFGEVETPAHGGFHCAAVRLVERMNFSHRQCPRALEQRIADRPSDLPLCRHLQESTPVCDPSVRTSLVQPLMNAQSRTLSIQDP